MKNAIVGLGACMLAGCSVPLIRPDAAQPLDARFSAAAPADGAAVDVDWWSRLGDAQLTEVLALSQANSPDLRSAAASVMAARARARQTDAGRDPTVNGNASITATAPDFDTRTTTSTALLDASWEVDLFGRARNAAAADVVRAQAEEVSYVGAYVSLAAEVAGRYVDYRACTLAQADYAAALSSQQDTLAASSSLVDAGISAAADLSLARANVASAEIALTNQAADCRVVAQDIARVVGVPQGKIDGILSTGGGLPSATSFAVTSVPANLLRQRPDVIAAERTFAASLLDLKVAQANLYPALTLGGAVTVSDPQSWSFGPALSLPILDGGASRASVRTANATALQAAEAYRSTVLTAVAEVEGALTRLAAARSNLESAERLVLQFQTYADAIDEDWRAGGATLLDREDARRQLQSARITRILQRQAVLTQWITLYKAVGGGWLSTPPSPTSAPES